MLQFILKITALDASLGVESYCAARMYRAEENLKSVCGERERLHHLALSDWLIKRFEEKDRLLDSFYSNGVFPTTSGLRPSE